MAPSLVIRAPFAAVPGAIPDHYEITEDFETTGRMTVSVDANDPARLALQPIFPGTLTFKPDPGSTPVANPGQPDADPVTGDLYLEMTDPGVFAEWRDLAPHFAYPLLVGYLGVALPPEFFTQTVLQGSVADPFNVLGDAAGDVARANAFAGGQIGVSIGAGDVTPDAAPQALMVNAHAEVQLAFGVRTAVLAEAPPSIVGLEASRVLDAPDFVPLPLAFFYAVLRAHPRWNEVAAPGHAQHPFLTALAALEDVQANGRWRRLRVALFGDLPVTPVPVRVFAGLTARGVDPIGTTLWQRPVNRLGELFVQRPAEAFSIEVKDGAGTIVRIATDPAAAPASAVALTWDAANGGGAGVDLFADVPADGDPADASLYEQLMQGDKDQRDQTVDPTGRVIVAPRRVVRALQRLLGDLGFGIGGSPDGSFGRSTSWAVREFQVYAGMDHVATEDPAVSAPAVYADRLMAIDNLTPYTGDITGIVDGATAAALRQWRDDALRCPVVADSWTMRDQVTPESVFRENIWLPTDDRVGAHRARARDLTGYYDPLPGAHDTDDRIMLGRFETLDGYEGMVSTKAFRTTWDSDTIVTPDRLIGAPATTPEAISTFKVVAAVAKAEAEAVFDAINAYDRGVVSIGVFHWILYYAPATGTELPAFLAWLSRAEPDEFNRFFQRFGLTAGPTWPDPGVPNPLFNRSELKWTGSVRQRGLVPTTSQRPLADPGVLTRAADAEYFRTWHWFYRWEMACRTSTAVQRQQWVLSRMRLRALLAAPWKKKKGFPALPPLGKVFSSERAAAALLRAHANQPNRVTVSGMPTDLLHDAYTGAGTSSHDPSSWTAADMHKLHVSLEAKLKTINTPSATRSTWPLATWIPPTAR
jgi:Putative peptidoglycan binding domain